MQSTPTPLWPVRNVPEDGYADGNCLNDTEMCNPFEVPGCDDPEAFTTTPSLPRTTALVWP